MILNRWKKKCIEYSKFMGFVYNKEKCTVNLNNGSISLEDEIFDFKTYDWCILGYPELKINDENRIIATYTREEIRNFKRYKQVQDAIALKYKELMVQMNLDKIKADFV